MCFLSIIFCLLIGWVLTFSEGLCEFWFGLGVDIHLIRHADLVCASHTRLVCTASREEAAEQARLEAAEAALRKIADREWVENCLDPQWPAQIARATLGGEHG